MQHHAVHSYFSLPAAWFQPVKNNVASHFFFHSESKNSDETDLYEIPVIKNASPNQSQGGESGGYAETKSPSKDDYATTDSIQEEPSPEVVPPPLPPRREQLEPHLQREQSITESTFCPRPDPPERQSSIKSDRPPNLPARPNLPTKSEMYSMAEKKDERSEGSVDLTGERSEGNVNLTGERALFLSRKILSFFSLGLFIWLFCMYCLLS